MRPLQHALYGLIVSLVLWYSIHQIGFFGFLVIFAASVLMDFDHYVSYVVIKRDFSLKKAYRYFCNEEVHAKHNKHYDAPLNIFHTIEAFIALIVLSWNNQFFFFIWAGWMIHYALDMYQTVIVENAPHLRRYSIIYYLIKKH